MEDPIDSDDDFATLPERTVGFSTLADRLDEADVVAVEIPRENN